MKFSFDRKLACCLIVALLPVSAWGVSEPRGGGEPGRPPQEAFEACRGKSEGSEVVITTPSGDTIKATCRSFNGQLVAVPEGPPPPPRGGGRGGDGN